MTTTNLQILLTSLTALVAVMGPVVSTCITIRSNERLRREELRAPKVYSAVSQMISAFHKFTRNDDESSYSGWDVDQIMKKGRETYTHFSEACFEVMSLVSNESIRCQLTDLLKSIEGPFFQISSEHETIFNKIIADIALELSFESSKRNHSISRKHKLRNGKDNRR